MSKENFRIVFMGTPEFALTSLKYLVNQDYNIVGIVTAPDKPAGRGRTLKEPVVKSFARQTGIPVFQPKNLKDPGFIENLVKLAADLFVVVAFRMLPEAVFLIPKKGTINLHASLLPDYRGAAPINWAIINGEKTTGLTTFIIEKEIDTGKILLFEETTISEDMTAGELHDILMVQGADLLSKTIARMIKCDITAKPQVLSKKYHSAPKLTTADCKINWTDQVRNIFNFIRGLSPHPAAWTLLQTETGKTYQIKVFRSEWTMEKHNHQPGSMHSDQKSYLKVAASEGLISIKELQLAGKNRMNIKEFLKGFTLKDGMTLS